MSHSGFMNVGYFQRNCSETTLQYDQACLQIIVDDKIFFMSQYEDCESCDFLPPVILTSSQQLIVKTTSPLRYLLKTERGDVCSATYRFMEFGQYDLNATSAAVSTDKCTPTMTAEPDAAYLPILTTAIILLSMATLWYIVKLIGKRFIASRFYVRYFAREDNELGSETRVLTTESSTRAPPTRSRLRSLDIFRGIAVTLMIFVNAGGGGYAVFKHAAWNGLTVADVVLPWFGFAMGEALVLSLHSRLRTAISRTAALGQVARRSVLLFLIGICLSSTNTDWSNFRIPGVLQLLAISYFVVGALDCAFMKTTNYITPGRSLFRDISAGWQQWLATLLIVATQIYVSLGISAGGCPRGYLGPGGMQTLEKYNQSLLNCTGGVAGYIDRKLFGPSHMYQHGTFKPVYHTVVPFDPEGALGALSFILVVQAGAHATRIMLAYNHARARIMRWLFWSLLFGLIGGGLCEFSWSGGVIPLNKNLRSVSYCLVTSSMAYFILAVLYFVVDLKNKWGGRPFYYAGQNALFLYVGSELLKKHFPLYISLPAPTHAQLLVTHAATTLIWIAVAVALHRKRVFITI